MKYIFLDDLEEIVEYVEEQNKHEKIPCTCVHINASDKSGSYNKILELIESEEENDITIITDFGIKSKKDKQSERSNCVHRMLQLLGRKTKYPESSYTNVFDYLLNDLIDVPEFRNYVSRIIVYSYQPSLKTYSDFILKINEVRENFAKKRIEIEITDKITSASFVRHTDLYDHNGDLNKGEVEVYKQYLSDFLAGIIRKEDNELDNRKNILLEKWIFQANQFFPDFKIGTVSYIAPEDFSDNYAFDVPYKLYYKQINDLTARKEEYIEFLKQANGERFNWLYFEIVKVDCKLKYKVQYSPNMDDSHSLRDLRNVREFWVKSLYASIYHQGKIDDFDNWCFVEEVHSFNGQEEGLIQIYWFYHEHHYDFLHKKGFLNFTLYKRHCSELTDEKEIKINAKVLYETNYNLIESKVLETLVPFYTSEMKLQSKRNNKLDLAAYNISHTYASHVFPFVDQFLDKIQDKIYVLYDSTSGIEKEKDMLDWFKAYYKEQREKVIRLAINLSAANDRFNKEVDKMYYANYKAEDVFNEKLASQYYTKKEDDYIISENGVSLGLTDGEASCVLHITTGDDLGIALPYGEIGVTMLMMLISNLFRNLKKHSINQVKYNYDNDKHKSKNGQYLNTLKELKHLTQKDCKICNYELSVLVKEIEKNSSDIEKRFADEYVKVWFEEISREHKCEDEVKNIAHDLTLKINDWSENNEKNWKGLKEMRMIASVLIGCPIEEIDFPQKEEIFEHKGKVYPKQLVTYEAVDNYLNTIIYLKKAKFANIWVSKEDFKVLNKDRKNRWAKEGINVKVFKKDSPNPLAAVPFVVDCHSGMFDTINDTPRKHVNFRLLKTGFDTIEKKEADDLVIKINKLWIEENEFFNEFTKCEYINGNKDIIFSVDEKSRENDGDHNENSGRKALIDDHFNFLKKKEDGEIEEYEYRECTSSKCQNTMMEIHNPVVEYLQREAVNTKVILYDEVLLQQIENDAKHPDWKEKRLEETLEWTGIHFAQELPYGDRETESLKTAYDGQGKSTLDDLIKHIKGNEHLKEKQFSYVIIHYSGFEQLYKRMENSTLQDYMNKNKDKSRFSNLSDKYYSKLEESEKFAVSYTYLLDKINFKGQSRYIVLCSGKFPNLLPDNAFFTDRESLKYYIFDISSKYQLINYLTQLRIQKYEPKDQNSNSY